MRADGHFFVTDEGYHSPTDADEPDPGKGGRRNRPWSRFLRELPGVIIVAFALAILIKTFLVQAFFIPSPSMLPTLEIDDRVLVSKLAYNFQAPEHGDLIVFDSPVLTDERPDTLWERAVRNVLEGVGSSHRPSGGLDQAGHRGGRGQAGDP